MNLFINYYKNSNRQHELDFCLLQNLEHELINNIIIFNESDREFTHSKIREIKVSDRPTYQDFFNATSDYQNDINIIANSDIYFDESLINAMILDGNTCYAITRHEIRKGKVVPFNKAHSVRPDYSQDVWMFRGKVDMINCDEVMAISQKDEKTMKMIRFTIGVPGCDNVIAAKLKSRYNVKNPCDYIRCIHKHADESRSNYPYRMTGGNGQWGIIRQGHLAPTGL